jgi:short-chain fatty acids transporter
MSRSKKIQKAIAVENFFDKYVPSPFGIAIILTIGVMVWAIFTMSGEISSNFTEVLQMWEKGIWNQNLLVFAYQMMLILVLGHILVLSQPMEKLLSFLTQQINTTSKAVAIVSITTMLMAFFNWGLGLIFGAILVRKIGEVSQQNNYNINYPLVGATGYIGLMVWHGGISGSAPLKVAEQGHLSSLTDIKVPAFIETSLTIFSLENLIIFMILLLFMPLFFIFLSKKYKYRNQPIVQNLRSPQKTNTGKVGFENNKVYGIGFGVLILVAFFLQYTDQLYSLRLTPNMLNFFMLGMIFILHQNFTNFLQALQEAVGDVSGILIQFPLYFGIMGIMKDSGLALQIAEFFVSISNAETLPIFSFLSAGLLNIFVPSGGGQWAIQGPIIIESSNQLGVPLPKMIMAMAYGDQITNMLQPFWALPLLAITKLKAHQILPYTIWMFIAGSLIFIFGLMFIY